MFEVCRQEGAFSHTPEDFEDIYADKIECCQAEISKIQKKSVNLPQLENRDAGRWHTYLESYGSYQAVH